MNPMNPMMRFMGPPMGGPMIGGPGGLPPQQQQQQQQMNRGNNRNRAGSRTNGGPNSVGPGGMGGVGPGMGGPQGGPQVGMGGPQGGAGPNQGGMMRMGSMGGPTGVPPGTNMGAGPGGQGKFVPQGRVMGGPMGGMPMGMPGAMPPHMNVPHMNMRPNMQMAPPQPPTAVAGRSNELGELTKALADAKPDDRKRMLGESLYPKVAQLYPTETAKVGKLTGMLLEMDDSELVHMLEDPELLKERLREAFAVLQSYTAQNTGVPGVDGSA